ncbi:hypothetical protein [Helicobacter sp. 23-1045]
MCGAEYGVDSAIFCDFLSRFCEIALKTQNLPQNLRKILRFALKTQNLAYFKFIFCDLVAKSSAESYTK